jgi:hypothetical protein
VVSTPANPPAGLARCLNVAGGISMSEACSRADLHLELMRERSNGVMEDCMAAIVALQAEIDGVPTPEARVELHRLSCSLAALGGMFQRDGLSKVAYSFCRLIDDTEPGWDAAAVLVHVKTMRLLFTPERVPADVQASLIDGLVKVRRCVTPPTPD